MAMTTCEPLVLRPKEAAVCLRLSLRTLRRLTAQGVIPSIKVGRLRLFPRAALEAWLAERAVGGTAAKAS
jgi:excisionase family DNA binding protein